jgi:beta-glucosidase
VSLFVRRRLLVASVVAGLVVGTMSVLPSASGADTGAAAPSCPWLDSTLPVEQRVDMVLQQMTVDEEVALLHGNMTVNNKVYSAAIPQIPRLCLPRLNLLGGPGGANHGMTQVTQFPAPVALAATWDRGLARAYGAAIGAEERGKNVSIVLGPTVDIVRDPRWGRAYETYGEDPYLNGRLAVSHILGVQGNGVIAQVKHLAAYNQETFRQSSDDNAKVDERTLQEIYLPAFQAAVEDGHVGSVMCALNLVNNEWACANDYLMNGVLKQQWDFNGFVTSDWYAMRDTVKSALAGIDMEMPNGCYFNSLAAQVGSGGVPRARLDDMVRRVLRKEFAFGLVGRAPTGGPNAAVTTAEHAALARRVAEDGAVLLKNRNDVLPFDAAALDSIAIVGTDAGAKALTVGGGSAHVAAPYVVTPLDGITQRAGSGVAVAYDDGSDTSRAATVASNSDVAVVFASLYEKEGSDLATISLSAHDNALITKVTQANPRTVVVLNSGSAVTMPWLSSAAGVIEAWYPGQEDGNAIAAVLFGDVDPAGRLPVTFPKSIADGPTASAMRWPGVGGAVRYDEGLKVGYRWYDAKNIAPLFPFGYGQSYTSFEMSGLTVKPRPGGAVDVTATVKNVGARAGAQVVQAYVEMPAIVREPPRRLVGFAKVRLNPGAQTTVHLLVTQQSLSFWDVTRHRWVKPRGTYTIRVGDSSRHLPLSASFTTQQAVLIGRQGPVPPVMSAPPSDATDCPIT